MKHAPITETVLRLVREVACTQCYQRPPGSEALGPEVPRSCEPTCPLFFHLPTLLSMAGRVGNAAGACETAVRDTVCGGCRLSPTAGEYCADYAARTCPVSRYSGDVIAALQRLLRVPPPRADVMNNPPDAGRLVAEGHEDEAGDHEVAGAQPALAAGLAHADGGARRHEHGEGGGRDGLGDP